MPEVDSSVFDKIRDLRMRKEKGLLPEDTDAFKTMGEHAIKYGFEYEEHTVVTEDGYILTVGRIPGELGKKNDEKNSNGATGKPAVILQHGLECNMMTWVFNTNDSAPAFVLARSGYDVWMPNNRGTYYSLGHTKLHHLKDREYWQWTWEEMGT